MVHPPGLRPQRSDIILSFIHLHQVIAVGHYNCLIDSNNQVIHKLSTQGSLLFQR
jgi:hypothetical protein